MSKLIVFLDVDGVLNSEETCKKWHEKTGKGGYGGFFKEEEVCTDENVKWGQDLVNNLKRIITETKAKIVISSTWRKFFSIDKFKEMFKVYGWSDAPVIDMTPKLNSRYRGEEVVAWVKENPIDNYVILDDDTDFLQFQIANFVNTNPNFGLTKEDAEKAIKILTGGV